jgi:hypothetical protein
MNQDENPYRSPESEPGERAADAPADQETVPLGDRLRDSMVGFALILVGFVLAGILSRHLLEPYLPYAYPIALWIGLIPFAWFAKWRRAVSFDFIDYLMLLVVVVVMSAVKSIGLSPDLYLLAFALIGSGCMGIYRAVRRRWFPGPADGAEES